MSRITNKQDVIDSCDIIARLEELETLTKIEDLEEFYELKKIEEQAETSPDWLSGVRLIRDTYFVQYTKELIEDCYGVSVFNNQNWPYRHITIDYEAAAEERKQDYFDIDFDGVTYWVGI